jgi:cation-transporting P-type ATPase E
LKTIHLLEGLSEREVKVLRARGQGNSMPPQTGRTYWQIVRDDVFPLVNTILYVLCLTLLLLGQISEAVISAGVVLLNAFISVIQEVRAKRMLARITLLTRPKATVIRDGQERSVDPSELVVGDLLRIHAGDQIVVDGPVVGDGRLEVDESLLSGESNPITKQGGDRLYSGSFCLTGSAYYRAEKVGSESVAGQLTKGARTFRRVSTPLQRQINLIIQSLLLVALYLESILVLDALANRTSVVDAVRMSVVVIGVVPIGLLLSSSVAYALASVRIAGKKALVQRPSAIESLSNVEVLCLDKTGTLTANALVLEKVHPFGIPEAHLRRLLCLYTTTISSQNASSRAIGAACTQQNREQALHIREEIPFSSAYKWSALAADDAELRGVYVLGAPEILRPFLRPDADLGTFAQEETAQGKRVLLFACFQELVSLRTSANEPLLPTGLTALGMVSLRDELRPHVRETLTGFAELGIQIKVISGDHPRTVAALAQQVGIANSAKVVSGVDMAEMDDAQFAQLAQETTIFGRIAPQQKARLVQTLRDHQHYVAMIGDGVNDVLALKRANLGIAMETGSQATRGVADIVLLKDSFEALPFAFAQGQRVRNGMHNVIKLFVTRVNYLALLLLSIPIVGGFPFAPKQKAILTFITASIISVALAAWAHPGRSSERKLSRTFIHFILPAALTQGFAGALVYVLALQLALRQIDNHGAGALLIAQSVLTTFSVFSGLLLVPFIVPPTPFWKGGSQLSGDWRPTLLALGMLAVFLLMVAIPWVRGFFSLAALDSVAYLLIGGATILWGLLQRWLWRIHFLERFLTLE